MKLRIFMIMSLLFAVVIARGQNFEVSDISSFSGLIGEKIEGVIPIRNNSEQPITLVIQRISTTIGTGQQTWFCISNDCLDPETGMVSTSFAMEIAPGETYKGFKSILKAGLGQGYSSVKYLVFEKSDPENSYELEVNYAVTEESANPALFSSRQLILNDVYPNPVSEFAIVDYAIKEPDTEAKIVIHSVLGSIIGEYKLQPLETRLKITTETFNPGVYFYTLYIENDGVMTRKLIVRQ